jgi:hypothetical protein
MMDYLLAIKRIYFSRRRRYGKGTVLHSATTVQYNIILSTFSGARYIINCYEVEFQKMLGYFVQIY